MPSSSNNSTATTTASGGSSETGGGGLFNIDIPTFDPVKAFQDLMKAIGAIPGSTFDFLTGMVFGVPAPGQHDDPTTWATPSNGLWPGVASVTQVMTGLAVLILTITGGMTFLHGDVYTRRQAWKRWAIGLIMVLATWTMLPLVLHIANLLAMELTPTSHGVIPWRNPGNAGKITTGLGVLTVFALIQPLIVGLGMIAIALERFLIYFGVAFWPLAWALRSTTYGLAHSIGETIVFLLSVALVTKIGQALVAYFLIQLNWGVSTALPMTLVLIAGVAFMLIIFPKKMLDHANDAASVSLGMSTSQQQAGRYIKQSKERIGQVQAKVNDWRTNESRSAIQTRLNDWDDLTNSGSGGNSSSTSGGSSGGGSSTGGTTTGQSTDASPRGPSSFDPDETTASASRRSTERKQREQARINDFR